MARAGVLVLLLVVAPLSSALHAQVPRPSVDAVVRSISLSQAQGIRLMGMGGVVASVPDLGNVRNPAAAVKLPPGAKPNTPFLVTSYGGTAMSPTAVSPRGTRFTARATTAGIGDGERELVVARLTRVSTPATRGIAIHPLTGAPTPVDQEIGYDAFFLGYARRLGGGLYGSLMLAAGSANATVYAPGTRTAIAHIAAKPDPGFEAGIYYELSDHVSFGGVWTSLHGVETTSFGGLPPSSRVLSSDIYRVGVSYRPDRWTTCAVEFGGLNFKDKTNGLSTDDSRLYLGAERWITPEAAVRVGLFGGQTSFGFGARIADVSVDYGYVRDLNKKSNQRLFPNIPAASSRTSYFAASKSF
jgi:hypothetical protein